MQLPPFLKLPPLHHMLNMPDTMVQRLCQLDKKVGVTFGSFDLLHAGHLLMFREAKTMACT
jgi:bifunctional ADP-heptose synthase (sugar kinase/adenylyltransferase)